MLLTIIFYYDSKNKIKYTLESLRNQVAVVLQDVFLFSVIGNGLKVLIKLPPLQEKYSWRILVRCCFD